MHSFIHSWVLIWFKGNCIVSMPLLAKTELDQNCGIKKYRETPWDAINKTNCPLVLIDKGFYELSLEKYGNRPYWIKDDMVLSNTLNGINEAIFDLNQYLFSKNLEI